MEDIRAVAEGNLVNLFFFRLEQRIPCVTISELFTLVFKFAQLNHFPHTPNKNRIRRKEMVLYVYVTTPTTKTEAVTQQKKFRAAAFSKDRVNEPFIIIIMFLRVRRVFFSLILIMKLVPPSLLRSSYVP